MTFPPQGVWPPPRVATLVVAANDSSTKSKAQADYVCDGVSDHVEIQAALDALPAAGGEVVLLEGTYNVEATITLDSYQTLRGCGRNTILTTSTADLLFLRATGTSGAEKVGIVIADLQIDGTAGYVSDCGICFEYVDHSLILNVFSWRHASNIYLSGIYLENSDSNTLIGNICQENNWGMLIEHSSYNILLGNTCLFNGAGIYLYDTCTYNTLVGNTTYANPYYAGIELDDSNNNTITGNISLGDCYGFALYNSHGNTFSGNNLLESDWDGIYTAGSDNNLFSGNTFRGNYHHGIQLATSDNNTVVGNTFTENSQDTNNADDDIYIWGSSYNLVQGNTCRAGAQANKPRYGINIDSQYCYGNLVIDNDLYNDGFGTAPFHDIGTGTKLNVFVVPFSDGSDPQDSGFLIDADTEMARAWLRLPDKVYQVVRMKVYARTVVLEAQKMRGEFVIYGGADNEAYNTHDGSVANHPSTSSNFAANDIIFWTIVTAGVLALLGGDSVEVKVLHEAAGDGDCATNGYFRTVEIEYV